VEHAEELRHRSRAGRVGELILQEQERGRSLVVTEFLNELVQLLLGGRTTSIASPCWTSGARIAVRETRRQPWRQNGPPRAHLANVNQWGHTMIGVQLTCN
jgi:hypothetical protein